MSSISSSTASCFVLRVSYFELREDVQDGALSLSDSEAYSFACKRHSTAYLHDTA